MKHRDRINRHDQVWAKWMVVDFMEGSGRPCHSARHCRMDVAQKAQAWIEGRDTHQALANVQNGAVIAEVLVAALAHLKR